MEIKQRLSILTLVSFSSVLQNNYKIQATRLTHEIDDMRRRLENAKMKLTAEMKVCHLTQAPFPTSLALTDLKLFCPQLWPLALAYIVFSHWQSKKRKKSFQIWSYIFSFSLHHYLIAACCK